jgi:beta-lactamase class D
MKKIIFVLFLFGLSCTENTPTEDAKPAVEESNEIVKNEFQTILDSAGVEGSILVLSDKDQKYYSNDFDWAQVGQLPASTFKVPNSIIALELGIMESDSTIIYWDGKPKRQDRWEQDLSFKEAFHASCVPCYKEIARKVGVERMKKFTSEMNYGKLDIDSTNLDMFWLEGKSTINQYEQISFLKTFNEQRLPISRRTYNVMQRLMIIEENDDYILRGKSGWSFQDNIDNCWFVGYLRTKTNFYYFATNIIPKKETDQNQIPYIRKNVTMEALKSIGFIMED